MVVKPRKWVKVRRIKIEIWRNDTGEWLAEIDGVRHRARTIDVIQDAIRRAVAQVFKHALD